MRALPALLALSLAACASGNQNQKLETRLATLEATQAKSDFEVRAAIARLEATIESMVGAVGRLDEASASADRLANLVDALEERIGTLDRRPAPSGRPVRRDPDAAKVYGIAVAGAPVRGKPDALVTIVRAGEYACPYCEKVRPTLDQLVADYPDDVRVVYKTFVVHPQLAYAPAYAACAAHKQGKFWEMDKLLWDRTFANREFEPAKIEMLAASIGLDMDRYRADLGAPCNKIVADEMAQLTQFGVGATPAFFINGRFLSGAQPIDKFKALVDEELTKAKAVVKKGTKKAKYYDQVIVKKGLPGLEPAPAAATP